ncbi:MAG: damage-control phosphatase ARMT1 family protein [Candidatus Hadarchaeaceae archaeon]
MRTYLDCIPCFIRQALEASRMATDDETKQEKALKAVLSELEKTSIKNKIPTQLARRVHRVVREVTKNNDPYAKLKDEYNRKALKMYPSLKRRVAKSKDRLLTAVKLAIAGNIIDFGPSSKFDLDKTIEDALSKDFAINHFNRFREALKSSKKIIYLGDNAGEIVFDRILLEELKSKDISFFVKGGPIINDATIEDAKFVGIDKIAKIEVVSNGDPGTGPDRLSKEFIKRLKDVDLVISKGQGNYETLSEVDANIFFLLKVKCSLIARDMDVELGSTVIK